MISAAAGAFPETTNLISPLTGTKLVRRPNATSKNLFRGDRDNQDSIWALVGKKCWYLKDRGKVLAVWPAKEVLHRTATCRTTDCKQVWQSF
jgi:hypothetical protein